MKRSLALSLVCFSLFAMGGCGDSSELETTASDNELTQWVSENPAPPEIPLSAGNEEEE